MYKPRNQKIRIFKARAARTVAAFRELVSCINWTLHAIFER